MIRLLRRSGAAVSDAAGLAGPDSPPSVRAAAPATLYEAPLATPVTLGEPECPSALRLRLAELGLRRGERVRVRQHTPGGGRVIEVAGTRLALDRTTCRQLRLAVDGPPAMSAISGVRR